MPGVDELDIFIGFKELPQFFGRILFAFDILRWVDPEIAVLEGAVDDPFVCPKIIGRGFSCEMVQEVSAEPAAEIFRYIKRLQPGLFYELFQLLVTSLQMPVARSDTVS